MSTNRFSKIHSNLAPLDSRGGETFSEHSSNGTVASVANQTMVATGAHDNEQNTCAVNHDLAALVWRYFENEIREALIEVQKEIKGDQSTDDLSHRRQKGK